MTVIPDSTKDIILYVNRAGVSTTAYNTKYKMQMPNIYGKVIKGTNMTLYDILDKLLLNPKYAKLCHEKADKYNATHSENERKKKGKNYAYGVFSSVNYRYSKYDQYVDENGKKTELVLTNMCYKMWNGFQGFDIDFPQDIYSNDEIVDLCKRIKPRLFDLLKHNDWLIAATLSTSGHGLHLWTCHKPMENDNVDEMIRYYELSYQYMAFKILYAFYKLRDEFNLPLQKMPKLLDGAMMKPEQPLNITVMDSEPLINENFKNEPLLDLLPYYETGADILKVDYDILNMDELQKDTIVHFNSIFNKEDRASKYKSKNDENIKSVNTKCSVVSEYDLSKCEKPFHWQHRRPYNDFFTIEQVINTLLCFYDKETIKDIWRDNRFYDGNGNDQVRYTESFPLTVVDENGNERQRTPNIRLVNFLNEHCGFNLYVETEYELKKKYSEYDKIIELKDDGDYIGMHRQELLSALKPGFNLLIAPTGSGKNELPKQINRDIINDVLAQTEQPILMCEPYNSISMSKYDPNEIERITGKGKRFNWDFLGNKMHVTNYWHIIHEFKDPEYFTRFKYIFIDESHLLTKEKFRSGDLIRLIKLLNAAAKLGCIIILMTGTPMDETKVFDIANSIKIIKKPKAKVEWIYRIFEPTQEYKRFDIGTLGCLTRYYLNRGRKVYIYWSNISTAQALQFKTSNPDLKIAVYHKRKSQDKTKDNTDMDYINTEHKLGDKYDVLISSVYFGVGNDLNDTCPAACIIVGNNPWQEDIQVIGRWRNSTDIEVCEVIRDSWDIYSYDKLCYDKYYNAQVTKLEMIYNDSTHRNGTVSIKTHIEDKNDIPIVAHMEASNNYYSAIELKEEMFREYYIDLSEDGSMLNVLKYSELEADKSKEYWKGIQDCRTKYKKEVLQKLANGEEVEYSNSDGKQDRWIRTVKYMHYNFPKLYERLVQDRIITSYAMVEPMQLYFELVNNLQKQEYDITEVASIVIFKQLYNKYISEYDGIDNVPFINGLDIVEHCAVVSYIYFYHFHDKNKEDWKLKGDYFSTFMWKCKMFYRMPEYMSGNVTEMYVNKDKSTFDKISASYDTTLKLFSLEDLDLENLENETERGHVHYLDSEKTMYIELVKRMNNKHLNAGRKAKSFEYEGKTYPSIEVCAHELGISRKTLYKRIKKLKENE